MRLGRCHVGLVELNRCACKSGVGVAALAFQPVLGAIGSFNHFRVIVGFEIVFDVRLVLGVRYMDRVRGGLGGLESVRHSKRNVLPIITNDVVFERRAPLYTDTLHPLSHG